MTSPRLSRRVGATAEWAATGRRPAALAWVVLIGASAAYAALALWLTRGITFFNDELAYFTASDGFAPSSLFEPHNGHLIALTRLTYASSLELFGASYLPIKLTMIVAVIACSVLLFVLIRRRVGVVPALAAAVLILFFGSSPVGITGSYAVFPQAAAFGLLGWLLLDRPEPSAWMDLGACLALVLSVLVLEVGVAFAVGAGLWILTSGSVPARRWLIFVVPILVYVVWYAWASRFSGPPGAATNVLLIVQWAADSLAATSASLAGLSLNLVGDESGTHQVVLAWGYPLALGLCALVVWRIRHAPPGPAILAPLGLMCTFWVAGTLGVGFLRTPSEARYVFPIAIGVLLLLAELFRTARISGRVMAAIVAALILSLPANLWLLRERGAEVRAGSNAMRVRMGVLELARATADPSLTFGFPASVVAAEYLASFDRYGNPGLDPAAIISQSPSLRATADAVLDRIVAPTLQPIPGERPSRRGCSSIGTAQATPLPSGGATLLSRADAPVLVGRFSDVARMEAGTLSGGRPAVLALPADRLAGVPWFVSATEALQVCPLPQER